jgi:hypothetical protein
MTNHADKRSRRHHWHERHSALVPNDPNNQSRLSCQRKQIASDYIRGLRQFHYTLAGQQNYFFLSFSVGVFSVPRCVIPWAPSRSEVLIWLIVCSCMHVPLPKLQLDHHAHLLRPFRRDLSACASSRHHTHWQGSCRQDTGKI